MPRDSARDLSRLAHRAPDRVIGLKRRVGLLARFSAPIVRLADGPWLVRIEKVTEPASLLSRLKADDGVVDLATLAKSAGMAAPPLQIDPALVATARRELKALASPPALALAKEHRRALARFGRVDETWLRERETDVARAHEALSSPKPTWFASVVDLVRARDGQRAALKLVEAHDDVVAAATERRRRARERITTIVEAMQTGTTLDDIELRYLAERLDSARDFPGRARRRRVLDVLRRALQWNDAPEDAVASLARRDAGADATFAETVMAAGYMLADSMPAVRDPKLRDQALEGLAIVALGFTIGDDGIAPLPANVEVKDVLRFSERRVSAAQAVALARIGVRPEFDQLATWASQGLEIRWIEDAIEKGYAASLTRVPDVRAARAYATWASRLVPHYKSLGISFSLTPELFAALPKNVDLGVLAVCLLEATKLDDPAAVLDATLGLFAKVPGKALRILTRLKAIEPGAARRTMDDFAGWLEADELLDRLVHVAKLAREPQPLTHRIREDFDHAQKIARELAHLEAMTKRNVPQEGRLALLRKGPRSVADAPKGRTKRRITERIEALLPIAYRRELDVAFREISREAWGVNVPALTPAWRDAVRFWLVVDDNKKLLGTLLRHAAKNVATPHAVKLASPKNREWIARAEKTIDVAAWLSPRRAAFQGESGARYTIELEEDPLEVLRMGIPFGTCLSLEDGCNAASTVLNALDANKRVIYVRGANGKVVARKLLALNEDLALIGYNLYVSVSGGDQTAIRRAVDRMCVDIAKDVGTRLTVAGKPAEIHRGFWYDDGVVAFAEDEVVSAYCRAHGLPPPKKTWQSLVDDARGWYASEKADVDGAIDALGMTDRSIANVILGRWIVDHLGLREATRRARQKPELLPAVCRVMADAGEAGIVRALDLLGSWNENAANHAATVLLDRAPRSAKIADALVRSAETIAARERRVGRWGLPHRTFDDVAPLVSGVKDTLAICDRLAPLWARIVKLVQCTDCLERGERSMIDAVLAAYEREPDDAAVVACLMSAKRTPLAHRAALRVAARHFLHGGERGLRRLTSHASRRALASSADGFAAVVRQWGLGAARALRDPTEPLFEALGPLLFTLPHPEIAALVARGPKIADEKWEPGPWELAWLRRHPDEARRRRLLADARRRPFTASRAYELLAMLGDREGMNDMKRAREEPQGKDELPALIEPKKHKTLEEIEIAFSTYTAQVHATENGTFQVPAGPIADRLYVERAKDALPATAPLVGVTGRLEDLLRCEPGALVDDAIATKLGSVPRALLDPALVAELWQRHAVRDALASAFVKGGPSFGAAVDAALRAAENAGLPLDGFFDAVVKAKIDKAPSLALVCESLDQQREVIASAVRGGSPAALAELYRELNDVPAVASFLRALDREPLDRAAAIRAAMTFDDDDDREVALKAWLEKRRKKPSSRAIERSS